MALLDTIKNFTFGKKKEDEDRFKQPNVIQRIQKATIDNPKLIPGQKVTLRNSARQVAGAAKDVAKATVPVTKGVGGFIGNVARDYLVERPISIGLDAINIVNDNTNQRNKLFNKNAEQIPKITEFKRPNNKVAKFFIGEDTIKPFSEQIQSGGGEVIFSKKGAESIGIPAAPAFLLAGVVNVGDAATDYLSLGTKPAAKKALKEVAEEVTEKGVIKNLDEFATVLQGFVKRFGKEIDADDMLKVIKTQYNLSDDIAKQFIKGQVIDGSNYTIQKQGGKIVANFGDDFAETLASPPVFKAAKEAVEKVTKETTENAFNTITSAPKKLYRAVDSTNDKAVLGLGRYYSDSIDTAKRFGKNIQEFILPDNVKLLDLSDNDEWTKFADAAMKDKGAEAVKIAKKMGTEKGLASMITDYAKKLGYDGIVGEKSTEGLVLFGDDIAQPVAKQAKEVVEEVTQNAIKKTDDISKRTAKKLDEIPGRAIFNELTEDQQRSLREVLEEPKVQQALEATYGKPLTFEEVKEAALTQDAFARRFGREYQENFISKANATANKLADKLAKNELDEETLQLIQTTNDLSSFASRFLNSMKITADGTSSISNEALKKILSVNKNTDEILAAAKNVDFDNPADVTRFYRTFVKPTLSEVLEEYRYFNLLSSPKTHVTNAAANLLQTSVTKPAVDLASAAIDPLYSKVTGKEQQYFFSEIPAYYKGVKESLPQAVADAKAVWRGEKFVGKPDLDRIATMNPITSKITGAVDGKQAWTTRALEAGDILFQTLIRGGAKEQIQERAAKTGVELTANQVDEAAQKAADYYLLRNALDPSNKSGQGTVLSAIDSWTASIYRLRKDHPRLGWIVPFVQTPMNQLKQFIEFTPGVGLVTLPGNTDKVSQLAKQVVGSTVFLPALNKAFKGELTWTAPADEKRRKEFYDSGRKEYSIKIGDEWVQYNRLGALGMPFALAAALQYQFQDARDIGDPAMQNIIEAFGNLTKYFADQSYLKAFGDLQDITEGNPFAINQFLSNIPRQYIPATGALGWLNRIIDPYFRKPDNPITAILRDIPGVSQTAPTYTDSEGNPSTRGGVLRRILNATLPFQISDYNPVYDLLYRTDTVEYQMGALERDFSNGKIDLKTVERGVNRALNNFATDLKRLGADVDQSKIPQIDIPKDAEGVKVPQEEEEPTGVTKEMIQGFEKQIPTLAQAIADGLTRKTPVPVVDGGTGSTASGTQNPDLVNLRALSKASSPAPSSIASSIDLTQIVDPYINQVDPLDIALVTLGEAPPSILKPPALDLSGIV